MHRFTLLAIALALTCALLAPLSTAQGQEPGTVRVGVVLPLSGEHEALGKAALDGLQWALDGALPGAGLVELDVRDSASDPERAAAEVAALAADPALVAIVGPLGAREARVAASAAQDAAVPLLTLTSVEDIERSGDWVFRLRLSPEDQARTLARFALSVLELRRAAVFFPEHDYGRSCMRAFVEAFVEGGGRVTAIEAYDPDDSRPDEAAELLAGRRMRRLERGKASDAPPATRLKKRARAHVDFDTLFIPDSATHVVRDLAFLELAGVSFDGGVQLLGTSAWASGSLAGSEGRAAGALVARLFDPLLDEAVEARVEAFVAAFERQPTELEAQAHDGMALLLAALHRCAGIGGAGRGCVQQSLRSGATVQGVTGTLALTADGGLRRELYLFDVTRDGELAPAY